MKKKYLEKIKFIFLLTISFFNKNLHILISLLLLLIPILLLTVVISTTLFSFKASYITGNNLEINVIVQTLYESFLIVFLFLSLIIFILDFFKFGKDKSRTDSKQIFNILNFSIFFIAVEFLTFFSKVNFEPVFNISVTFAKFLLIVSLFLLLYDFFNERRIVFKPFFLIGFIFLLFIPSIIQINELSEKDLLKNENSFINCNYPSASRSQIIQGDIVLCDIKYEQESLWFYEFDKSYSNYSSLNYLENNNIVFNISKGSYKLKLYQLQKINFVSNASFEKVYYIENNTYNQIENFNDYLIEFNQNISFNNLYYPLKEFNFGEINIVDYETYIDTLYYIESSKKNWVWQSLLIIGSFLFLLYELHKNNSFNRKKNKTIELFKIDLDKKILNKIKNGKRIILFGGWYSENILREKNTILFTDGIGNEKYLVKIEEINKIKKYSTARKYYTYEELKISEREFKKLESETYTKVNEILYGVYGVKFKIIKQF